MATLDDRIKALEEQLRQAKAKRAKAEARARAEAAAKARSADTRRKVLIGATILAEIEGDDSRMAWLNDVLARRLTRPDERALFGLDAIPEPAPVPDPGT